MFGRKCNGSNAQTLGDVNDIANLQGGIAEALPFIDPQQLELRIAPKHEVAGIGNAIATELEPPKMHPLFPAKHPSVPTIPPTKPTLCQPIQEFPVGRYRS